MRDFSGKRYWLVGASEGLGAALAHALSRVGAEVVLSARSEDRLAALAAELPGRASVVPIDVADDASVAAAAEAAGEIDGVVFLAGVYWPMKSTEWDAEKATAMVDINFTGAVRVMGAIVPRFVERGSGHIVLTGSLSGFRGLPGAIGYGASKAGVMALAECMQADLHRSGIEVQLVNPGFIKTRLTDKNDFAMPFIMEPDEAARVMLEHMGSDRFKRSFPRVFSWLFRGSQFLPDWAYYAIFGARG
jgi:NADP-dependent 3-hydroxy acid dehydrogenase YdfG